MSGIARCIPDEETFFGEHWQKALPCSARAIHRWTSWH